MDENRMTNILLQLADLGVTAIKIHYSGGGDSGAIDSIIYSTEPNIDFDEIEDLNSWTSDFNLSNLKIPNMDLYNEISDFADDKILTDIEDWWNNDGGYGNLCIKVPSGEYKIFNNIYITNTESYHHQGNLIEKTLN